MGFTTGFMGGLTLTYSVLYLTIYLHKANRNVQHTLLSQQSVLLNSIVEPVPQLPDLPAYEVRKDSMVEMMKDRWNGEVEGLVHRAQNTDWNEVRERWEKRIGNIFSKMRQSEKGQELENRFKENVFATDDSTSKSKSGGQKATNGGPRLLELK